MKKKETIEDNLKKYLWSRWWERVVIIIFVIALMLLGAGQVYSAVNGHKIYPGVVIGSFPVGGLTLSQAEENLQTAVAPVRSTGLVFTWNEHTASIPSMSVAPNDPDLTYEVISYDTAKTLDQAWAIGRTGSWLQQWTDRLQALLGGVTTQPVFAWRQDSVLTALRDNFATFAQPGGNAQLVLGETGFTVSPERAGTSFDYTQGLKQAEEQLASLIFTPIVLELKRDVPTITLAAAETMLSEANEFFSGGETTLHLDEQSWKFTRAQLNGLLEIQPQALDATVPELGISRLRLAALLAPIISTLSVVPEEPKFKMEGTKVVEFKPAVAGRTVDIETTAQLWEQALLAENKTDLELAVATTQPQGRIEDLNNLGIKELLGMGKSNFAGSPKNRRHNIKIGAEAVNGTLIPPGEEFSLLKTLGKIDAKAGYLPELVIKGNKTVPEYGGGLCQIGTTTFRGTLAAGLPVTERQNHSYQVTYYANEKGLPGTDATIYEPKPDYRFKNDTPYHVLIATRISGDDLFFEYWGTKDGRLVEQSDVRVWDRVAPGPAKLIETLDLKPGQKKCTERPHAGIKAAFDYNITYPNGEAKKTTFTSQYRPWQEVCLIGVEKLSTDTAASSTPNQFAPQDAPSAVIN